MFSFPHEIGPLNGRQECKRHERAVLFLVSAHEHDVRWLDSAGSVAVRGGRTAGRSRRMAAQCGHVWKGVDSGRSCPTKRKCPLTPHLGHFPRMH